MTSFWRQTYCLFRRNLLLKRRNIKQLLLELVVPCLFIAALAVIQSMTATLTFDPEKYDTFHDYQLLESNATTHRSFFPDASKPWAYTPNTTDTSRVMGEVQATFGDHAPPEMLPFSSEADMVAAFNRSHFSEIDIGVVFSHNFPDDLTLVIRMPYGSVASKALGPFPDSELCFSFDSSDGSPGLVSSDANSYLYSGFAALQVVLQNAVAKVVTGQSIPVPDMWVRMFPLGEYFGSYQQSLLLCVVAYVLMYGFFVSILLTNLVYEKEKKIKENMLMMGMSNAAFWLAWFMVYGIVLIVVSLIITLLSKYAINTTATGDFFLVFLILFLYGMSLISLAFMLTPFFNKAVAAGVFATVLTLILTVVYVAITLSSGVDISIKWLLSFFSPTAAGLAMDQALLYETLGPGIHFDNIGLDGYPPYVAMLAIDTALYFLLAVYFDNVIPGNYGQHKPPWFCFMPSYWRKGSNTGVSSPLDFDRFDARKDVEKVSPEMRATTGIRICNLSKTFKGGWGEPDVLAVKDMTLDVYEGQITCLLGHNGAGKTTLINTLTGLITADSGQATICGYSIRDPIQMQKIRSMMGVCPQEDTLFDTLSPREHLKVYAGLKGVPSSETNSEVEKMLRQIQLIDSANTKSKNLSGGQKRKLCVGIALIGDPKVLFLDEPSSGMDPYSRRQMWSLLKNQRQGRIMVLTTHFMEEADILADRKAVMSRGSLRCYGSSLFLKNRFGIGYHLGMVVEQDVNVQQINQLVTRHIPEGKVSRSHGMELSYTLPLQESDKFPGLFQALEETTESGQTVAKQLGIQSYGVSMTTLEEVFLKLSEEEEADEQDLQKNSSVLPTDDSETTPLLQAREDSRENTLVDADPMSLDVEHYITQPLRPGKYQIRTLCKAQLQQILRSPKTYFFRLVFPCLIMVLAAILTATVTLDTTYGLDEGPLILDPKMYVETTSHSSRLQTPLLYENNLTMGEQDIKLLTDQFHRMGLVNRGIDDVSQVMSVAPHNLAIVADSLGEGTNETPKAVAMYNCSAVHSLPITLNILSNAFLPLQTRDKRVLDMTIASHPFQVQISTFREANPGIFMMVGIGLAMVIPPMGFMINVVKERQDQVLAQLRVSGVSMANYWVSHFLIDAAQMFLIVIVAVILSLASGFSIHGTSLTTAGGMFVFAVFMIIFTPLSVLFSYCLSFLLREYKMSLWVAQLLYIYLPVFIAVMTIVLHHYVLGALMPMLLELTRDLGLVFSFLYPPFSVFMMLYHIESFYQQLYRFEQLDTLTFQAYMTFDALMLPIIICVLLSLVVVVFLLYFLDTFSSGGNLRDVFRLRKRTNPALPNDDIIEDEDSDVRLERQKVEAVLRKGSRHDEKCIMAASGIRKVYNETSWCCYCCRKKKYKAAVRNLSLSVNEGEVFGLLGPNGAGKTTSMNVMTAETKPARGQVQVAGYNITSSRSDAFCVMGYCPQNNPLYANLTMREHLEAYGKINGVHPDDAKTIAQHFMSVLNISEHANKKAQQLSGGTKRKLCFAISMIGKPKIVFLDEPSTGMDPTSKRFLWNTIISSFRGDRGAVLTTHSMEEADAVCSRVGIMVSGKLMCLGTTQHLKGKYGRGYSLEVKLNPGPAYYSMDHTSGQAVQLLEGLMAALDTRIKEVFPSAEVAEKFGERVVYKVPSEDVRSLSTVFASLEEGKETLHIEEYSFSQPTLEQVFLEFASMQRKEEDESSKTSDHCPSRVNLSVINEEV
ncbi:ATP-binding cassette sub-family A member 10-like [Patiria miniata]|uniref:ABC transporter domain-containing protein n=1 Tax=Patiria miniata TaxID=46514 RepID=A0A914AM06_PATMI|nr:ATP-binding cassette sub-family A member 10-like [Patiria miniata]